MDFVAARVAEAARGRLLTGDPDRPRPRGAVLDSRAIQPGDRLGGLGGVKVDGGEFGERALDAGAWGVLVPDAWADAAAAHGGGASAPAVIAVADPLAALQ